MAYQKPDGAPPSYPQQAHYDAGPVGDPRAQNNYYGSPGPNQYANQPYQQGPYGPPQGQYGPPQGGPYQQQPMMYQQQPYGPGPGYYQQERRGGGGEGICAGILAAFACCCCLDCLF